MEGAEFTTSAAAKPTFVSLRDVIAQSSSDRPQLKPFRGSRELETPAVHGHNQRFLTTFSGIAAAYHCQICLGRCLAADAILLAACGHAFCRECLSSYLELRVREASVTILPCPWMGEGTEGCGAEIAEADVEDLLEPELLRKLELFRQKQADPRSRECPRCSVLVRGGSAWRPRLRCGECATEFCFVHGGAHPGSSCRQYERSRRTEERATSAAVAAISWPCPGCKTPIERMDGCQHMKCPNCQANFCWLCGRDLGRRVGTFPVHYAQWNLCGCPGLQMRDNLLEGQTRRQASQCMCVYRFVIVLRSLALFVLWFLGLVVILPLLAVYYPLLFVLYLLFRSCGKEFSCPPDPLVIYIEPILAFFVADAWHSGA